MSNIVASNQSQGIWWVGEGYTNPFTNKYQAVLESSRTNASLHYTFHHDVFKNFDRNLLGQFSLDALYKQRAQQLREKYDYLILYFSGGADSYNVLRSFIDNGIKLDEVCVKWAMPTLTANRTIYNPNTSNLTAENYLSEWNYAIQPVLFNLKNKYPEIKIQIVNWMPDVEKPIDENLFTYVNHWHDIELPVMTAFSPNEAKLISQGKTVGAIYGIDKPKTYFHTTTAYMFFSDASAAMAVANPINVHGAECFYWTPDMPLLPFEMARVAILWQLQNKERFSKVSYRHDNLEEERKKEHPFQNQYFAHEEELRHVLYTTWTNRYQAKKPIIYDRKDKHKWITEHDQLKTYRESFTSIQHSMMNNISNTEFYNYSDVTNSYIYKPCRSPVYSVIENYPTYLERLI